MSQSNISEQAQKYAEVITSQIIDNFDTLVTTMKQCKEIEKVKKEYSKLSPEDDTLMDIDNVKKRLEIIENHIGDMICDEYNSVEPLAVGLFGEWGSGKTHQLKLIKKHLLLENKKEAFTGPMMIPVFFNAWRFEKEEHIIIPLFQTLLDAVENHERTLQDNVKRSLKSTAYHLKNVLFSLHHGISWSSAYKTARGMLTNKLEDMREGSNVLDMQKPNQKAQEITNKEQIGKQILSELITPDRMESIYLNIPQWIEKITLFENVNFVFLIDDLDRCLPENTLKMLESIKLFLDVPSCAFVLAVDDDVVERGVVHHYRDYLSIYHHKDTEDAKGVLQHELPITGHEYLEKMVQLPIRLPVIDIENARQFLREHSKKWVEIVDKREEARVQDDEGDNEKKRVPKESEQLLAFFAKHIPLKPRKLIRTAKLFETKLLLLGDLIDKVDLHFVAKLTLLELFAPELLRFIQNNGYGVVFNSLCHFREASYQFHQDRALQNKLQGNPPSEPVDKFYNSLSDINVIKKYIDTPPGIDFSYTTKEKILFHKALKIIEKYETNRITFDLDTVFEKSYDTEKLKLIVEMQESKEKRSVSSRTEVFSDELLVRLFRGGGVDAWKDSLEEHNAEITQAQLEYLIERASKETDKTFNDLTFISNPEWVGVVANYLNEDLYIRLLKASYKVRFKTLDDLDFEIDMFEMTFAEYDKYCKLKNLEKPSDQGWGRGRRPAVNVSWSDVQAYIQWLNEKQDGYTYALPSNSESELACNLGQDTKWHFGDDENELEKYAWYRKNSDRKTHKVGERIPNALGLYDMHGNVWEWCEDWYDEDEDTKVLKGGSWSSSANYTQPSSSNGLNPLYGDDDVGFRLLRTLR
ncbi:P-loop NTPase fold protein [Sulfurovum sp.]|uniref:P-loop NTPase fold protein n=1 Tax=Sulfurovum sp. TaxID=1969726 RepID=UPI0025DADA6D|nr:P-loop NTPase fold protein [Sulfurovum sp.]